MRNILSLLLLCAAMSAQTINIGSGSCTLDTNYQCTITLPVTGKPVPNPISVTIAPATGSLQVGQTQAFTATVANSSGVTWKSIGSVGTIDGNGLFTATAIGTGTVVATSIQDTTKSSSASVTVIPTTPPPNPTGFDGPAELPRVYLDTNKNNQPTPGNVIAVQAGGLQAALTAANCGDILQLAIGSVHTGVFTFPAKLCDDQHWIQVRTAAADNLLPVEGQRLLPCFAGVASLPGRPAFNCISNAKVTAQIIFNSSGTGPIKLASGANHYRIGPGLEITRAVGTGVVYPLISASGKVTNITTDRLWIHGTAQDETQNGLLLNGVTNGAAIDSYYSDFHCVSIVGSCSDSHAIGGGTSSTQDGPYKIVNNFLESAGQGILFGGGSATFTPADMEISQNHFFKPLTWLKGQPNFVGGANGNAFIVKNHFELKNGQRVLAEGNIYDYVWGGYSQNGYAVLLTPKNQAGPNGTNLCPLCKVSDVTIRYSTISHAGAGISLANVPSDNGGSAAEGSRYSIHDIILDDIQTKLYAGNGILFQVMNSWTGIPLNSIKIDHITGFPDPTSTALGGVGKIMSLGNTKTLPMTSFIIQNSIIGQNPYPIWSTGGVTNCAIANIPLTSLNTCFPQGYAFQKNVVIGVVQANYPTNKWPANNYTANGTSTIPTSYVQFIDVSGGNYKLLSSSPYYRAGTDGNDLGADTDAINAATAGVK